MSTSPAPADPLEGEWHQRFTCEQSVRTFQRALAAQNLRQRKALAELKGNTDTSVSTLIKEYTREFAWGPNAIGPIHGAVTATQAKPTTLCKGAPDRERTLRIQQGYLVVEDWDGSSWGAATYKAIDDHAFTVNDGGQQFGDVVSLTDTFSFRIQGDKLTLTPSGQVDAWAGTSLVEATWHRVN